MIKRLIKRAAAIAKFLVPAIIGFFIGRVIYRNWQQVREAEWVFEPLYLLMSLGLTAAWFMLRPWIWKIILERFGHAIPFHAAFRITRRAELSRYVPGTIWQYVSRVYLADFWGVPAAVCLAATFVETVLLLLASISPALWDIAEALPFLGRHHRVLLVAVPLVALGALHPRVLNWWARFLSRRLKQPYVDLNIHWLTMAGIWTLYLALWIVHGLAVALFIRGVMVVPAAWWPYLASDYIFAWLVGMISMIAPAGMGIRDGVFGLVLGRRLPLGTALTIAVAVRLWLTIVELFWTFGGQWLIQRRSVGSEAGPSRGSLR